MLSTCLDFDVLMAEWTSRRANGLIALQFKIPTLYADRLDTMQSQRLAWAIASSTM